MSDTARQCPLGPFGPLHFCNVFVFYMHYFRNPVFRGSIFALFRANMDVSVIDILLLKYLLLQAVIILKYHFEFFNKS